MSRLPASCPTSTPNLSVAARPRPACSCDGGGADGGGSRGCGEPARVVLCTGGRRQPAAGLPSALPALVIACQGRPGRCFLPVPRARLGCGAPTTGAQSAEHACRHAPACRCGRARLPAAPPRPRRWTRTTTSCATLASTSRTRRSTSTSSWTRVRGGGVCVRACRCALVSVCALARMWDGEARGRRSCARAGAGSRVTIGHIGT